VASPPGTGEGCSTEPVRELHNVVAVLLVLAPRLLPATRRKAVACVWWWGHAKALVGKGL
jgi:hypothetical protein